MPLVTIDLLEGRSAHEIDAISTSVQDAMVESLNVPERDRFHLITQHQRGSLRFDPGYLDIERDEKFILVRVTLAKGRTTEKKQAFYRLLSQLLADRLVERPENLTVVLVENEREDWSFGRGQASYVEIPRERWR